MLVRNVGRLPTKLHDVITQKRENVNVMYVIDMHKCGSFNVLVYSITDVCSVLCHTKPHVTG